MELGVRPSVVKEDLLLSTESIVNSCTQLLCLGVKNYILHKPIPGSTTFRGHITAFSGDGGGEGVPGAPRTNSEFFLTKSYQQMVVNYQILVYNDHNLVH